MVYTSARMKQRYHHLPLKKRRIRGLRLHTLLRPPTRYETSFSRTEDCLALHDLNEADARLQTRLHECKRPLCYPGERSARAVCSSMKDDEGFSFVCTFLRMKQTGGLAREANAVSEKGCMQPDDHHGFWSSDLI